MIKGQQITKSVGVSTTYQQTSETKNTKGASTMSLNSSSKTFDVAERSHSSSSVAEQLAAVNKEVQSDTSSSRKATSSSEECSESTKDNSSSVSD